MKNYIYRNAEFLVGAHKPSQFPSDHGREVAFAGRSNSGKSSVINVLAGQRALARVSKSPGRTQQINFFTVSSDVRLVDLPGYGYANVPEKLRQHWGGLMRAYFTERKSLKGLILVTDIRRGLTAYDDQMLAWSAEQDLPVHLLLNKSDKLTAGAARQALAAVSQTIDPRYTSVQLFSVLKRDGLEEACQWLDKWLV